ncbi:hypothetical protein HD553DRAFT_302813 [Filobasidium floriforme]|uniref:uncharacterized protein n=1 Tax=Filobasidium floriforme TaxID=5210 RepID=UPI001E8DC1F4|nr:uncharacterized protein HD553DRAFT_302813 [Filobasidium floriforme]KAH8090595.1 hypothetical protein HD553DRAFT_302813 [Filobasidium floriforme]
MKTVHYLGELDHGLGVNDQFIYNAIDAAVSHTANANRAHIKSYVGTLQAARCDVPNNTFVWIAKHAFARIMREKGDKWETVRTVLEEDLRHHRCVHLNKDRRLRKIMRQTWEDVSKVTF